MTDPNKVEEIEDMDILLEDNDEDEVEEDDEDTEDEDKSE